MWYMAIYYVILWYSLIGYSIVNPEFGQNFLNVGVPHNLSDAPGSLLSKRWVHVELGRSHLDHSSLKGPCTGIYLCLKGVPISSLDDLCISYTDTCTLWERNCSPLTIPCSIVTYPSC